VQTEPPGVDQHAVTVPAEAGDRRQHPGQHQPQVVAAGVGAELVADPQAEPVDQPGLHRGRDGVRQLDGRPGGGQPLQLRPGPAQHRSQQVAAGFGDRGQGRAELARIGAHRRLALERLGLPAR
jgi:hypothetical protein